MKIRQRHLLKNKDIKDLKVKLAQTFGEENIEQLFSNIKTVEWLKIEEHEELIAIDNVLSFWFFENQYIPLISMLIRPNNRFKMKSVNVDKGAIPFVAKGADIMRPGIIRIDQDIKKDDTIKILDPIYNRPLAVGIALFDGSEMEKLDKGKVIRNIHNANDEIFAYSKEIQTK
jgi:PUA domain protein